MHSGRSSAFITFPTDERGVYLSSTNPCTFCNVLQLRRIAVLRELNRRDFTSEKVRAVQSSFEEG